MLRRSIRSGPRSRAAAGSWTEVVTPFGIRKLEFDAEFGFKLNGERLKMKGVCLHQNMGAAGSALTDDMWHRRLVQLKEMGCNAIRTSHYAYAPEFYRMCDEMGFMVVDEPWDGWFHWYGCHKAQYDYTIYFLDWWEQDLAEFIKRDRNHPSVVIWCIGNEVWGWERHHYLQWKIVDTFHKMDPTRPTVQAHTQKLYPDLAGFNADGENIGDIEKFRKEQPARRPSEPKFRTTARRAASTEASARTTRGTSPTTSRLKRRPSFFRWKATPKRRFSPNSTAITHRATTTSRAA